MSEGDGIHKIAKMLFAFKRLKMEIMKLVKSAVGKCWNNVAHTCMRIYFFGTYLDCVRHCHMSISKPIVVSKKNEVV